MHLHLRDAKLVLILYIILISVTKRLSIQIYY